MLIEDTDSKELIRILDEQKMKRREFTNRILSSVSQRKIIVSGPGTGKTFTFKELLKTKKGNCLVLTFIRKLAERLRDDIGSSAKTCTFHSYCKELLHKIKKEDLSNNFILFLKLEDVIKSDAEILYCKQLNFLKSFRTIDLSNRNIAFFLERSSYYDAVSFDDSVYRVMEYLKYNPQEIPSYDQVVVDEYQDFNKLEVEFLNILSEKSPVLIVGDDDQALYGLLKSASAKYIREKYNDPKYEHFDLPFCSRCTQVIIQAVQDIISYAKKENKLKDRIDKDFFCFLPDKLKDSQRYPKIVHAHCSVQSKQVPFVAKFIESEIDKFSPEKIKAANSQSDYTVLVVGSGHYLGQVQNYFYQLKEKYQLFFREDEYRFETLKIIDGYKILLEENELSNLGWRIVLEFDRLPQYSSFIKKTELASSPKLTEILPSSYINKHKHILNSLRGLMSGEQISVSERQRLEDCVSMKIDEIKDILESKEDKKKSAFEKKDNDKISIVFTTYVGCKGLSAGYVFIIGLDEKSLPRNNLSPSDVEISDFIVALTRTIKKCYLISTSRFLGIPSKPSIFLSWINPKRLSYVKVDKFYFGK